MNIYIYIYIYIYMYVFVFFTLYFQYTMNVKRANSSVQEASVLRTSRNVTVFLTVK